MELGSKIEDMIVKELIVLNLKAHTKEEAIETLADVLYKNGKLYSKEIYIKDVLDREKYSTTGIGRGIAIPHGKSEGVKETSIAIGKLSDSIDWKSLDGNPVRLVFLLSIRMQDVEEMHLRILAHIATIIMDEQVVNEILKAKTSQDIIRLLCL